MVPTARKKYWGSTYSFQNQILILLWLFNTHLSLPLVSKYYWPRHETPLLKLLFSPHTSPLSGERATVRSPGAASRLSALGSSWKSGSLAGSCLTPFQAGLQDVSEPLGNVRVCLLSGRCGLSARRGAETTQRGNFCEDKQSSSSPGAASPLSTEGCLGAGIKPY